MHAACVHETKYHIARNFGETALKLYWQNLILAILVLSVIGMHALSLNWRAFNLAIFVKFAKSPD